MPSRPAATAVLLGLLLLAAPGCHDRGGASTRPAAAAGDDDTPYDASRPSRTGVYVDPRIARACGVGEPETFFAFDSTELPPRSRATLDRLASCLRSGKLQGHELVLVGHADPRGTDRYNEELGKSRADAVADYLREHGVPLARIETESHGESHASTDRHGWPRDRRVDLVLDDDQR